jgi:predicted nucleotidyltransferase
MGRLFELRQRRPEILEIAERHGAKNIRIFGSTARGEDTETSDIDFLIDYGAKVSFLFPGGFLADLEKLLKCQIDIVTDRALRPPMKDIILREAVAL